eukprot:6202194-Prorocentrum_lima.AAC.1
MCIRDSSWAQPHANLEGDGSPTPSSKAIQACHFLFPRGLEVPGMLHVVNNLAYEVDTALDHWPWWLVAGIGAFVVHAPSQRTL